MTPIAKMNYQMPKLVLYGLQNLAEGDKLHQGSECIS